MRVNVHAGHNPDEKVACGAVGFIKESTEARKVKDEVICQLRALGHTVYDCTVNDGLSKSDILKKIVSKCNAHTVDLDISIHFNSAAGLYDDGKTTGTEALVYSGYSKAIDEAEAVCKAIAELGFKNRGVKFRPDLYVLRNTSAPAMLVECCFVNDKDDVELYDHHSMAKAIVKGITGMSVVSTPNEEESDEEIVETPVGSTDDLYRVQVGAYRDKTNAENMKKILISAGFDCFITQA